MTEPTAVATTAPAPAQRHLGLRVVLVIGLIIFAIGIGIYGF